MIQRLSGRGLLAVALAAAPVLSAHAGIDLIATSTVSGTYQDLSDSTSGRLENGVPGNRLGGMGSAIAYAGDDTFVLLPDRGPNAVTGYGGDPIDNTVSYINRFQTFSLRLLPNTEFNANPGNSPTDVTSLPFILTPVLKATTLLSSPAPLAYGAGGAAEGTDFTGKPTGPGTPALNFRNHTHYFTGRSDNFDPPAAPPTIRSTRASIPRASASPTTACASSSPTSTARSSTSSAASPASGCAPSRCRATSPWPTRARKAPRRSPATPAAASPTRAWRGSPSRPTAARSFGAMQSPLIQDGGTTRRVFTRIVTIDTCTGARHEHAYALTNIGSAAKPKYPTISEWSPSTITSSSSTSATATASATTRRPPYKKLYRIDLAGAADVSGISGEANLAGKAVTKTLFLDVVATLNAHGIAGNEHPGQARGHRLRARCLHRRRAEAHALRDERQRLRRHLRRLEPPGGDRQSQPVLRLRRRRRRPAARWETAAAAAAPAEVPGTLRRPVLRRIRSAPRTRVLLAVSLGAAARPAAFRRATGAAPGIL